MSHDKLNGDFNSLPFETRKILSRHLIIDQIRDLRIEKERTKKHYRSHLREINEHIGNCERALREEL